MLTVDELKEALPPNLKGAATQSLADKINQASNDPEAAQAIRENFISYSNVLKEGRFKVEDYLNAVSYVSYKLMNYNNQESYKRAFPARYQALVAAGRTDKQISAYVANYNGNKLVNLILEQSVIPAWIMFQDVYQEAIKTQFELMRTANSEKVRAEAANSILTHLKRPETKKVEVDLGVRKDTGLEALKDMMTQLAQTQLETIQQGTNTREIAHQVLVPRVEDEVLDAEIIEDPEA
jgi:hypothetical protein